LFKRAGTVVATAIFVVKSPPMSPGRGRHGNAVLPSTVGNITKLMIYQL